MMQVVKKRKYQNIRLWKEKLQFNILDSKYNHLLLQIQTTEALELLWRKKINEYVIRSP